MLIFEPLKFCKNDHQTLQNTILKLIFKNFKKPPTFCFSLKKKNKNKKQRNGEWEHISSQAWMALWSRNATKCWQIFLLLSSCFPVLTRSLNKLNKREATKNLNQTINRIWICFDLFRVSFFKELPSPPPIHPFPTDAKSALLDQFNSIVNDAKKIRNIKKDYRIDLLRCGWMNAIILF